ncbi:MAG: hypothetical protein CL912_21205 [Deltaproteobacteria bacterium]|nr:hypothetical protein [Deltaproteobacteria bacterium]
MSFKARNSSFLEACTCSLQHAQTSKIQIMNSKSAECGNERFRTPKRVVQLIQGHMPRWEKFFLSPFKNMRKLISFYALLPCLQSTDWSIPEVALAVSGVSGLFDIPKTTLCGTAAHREDLVHR